MQERQYAVSLWLLTAADDIGRAREEWTQQGVALLRSGGIFAVVRMDGDLVRAAAKAAVDLHDAADVACDGEAASRQVEVDTYLRDAVRGPVFYDQRGDRYYALVPTSTVHAWATRAFPKTEAFGRNTYIGVPAVTATGPGAGVCYWSVSMDSPGELCSPLAVAALVRAGRKRLAERQEPPAVSAR